MSNYSSLKATINANVKQNGNQEITGVIMNSVLNAMVDSLGAGYQYKGVATPATNPGTPDYNVFYLASEAGTYTNFGGLVIGDNEVAALVYNGSWSKQTTGAATAAEVSQLAQKVDEFAQGKFYGYFGDADELPAGDVPGFAYVGTEAPFAIYNFDGDNWSDSGLTVDGVPVGNGEDIDFNADGLLQFADRAYDSGDPNGMGYVILRKNKTFAEQVTAGNTVYEIRYDFTLGEDFTIPSGCILRFNGGSISGSDILTFTNTVIEGDANITSEVGGTIDGIVNVGWFGLRANDDTFDNGTIINKVAQVFKNLHIPNLSLYFTTPIVFDNIKTLESFAGLNYVGTNTDCATVTVKNTIGGTCKFYGAISGYEDRSRFDFTGDGGTNVRGLEILNCNNSEFYFKDINYFNEGLRIVGDTKGCAYNSFELGVVKNSNRGIRFYQDNGGWVNENKVYNGRIYNDSNFVSATIKMYAVYICGPGTTSDTYDTANAITIFGTSMEGFNQDCAIYARKVQYCDFSRIRAEGVTTLVKFISSCTGNKADWSYPGTNLYNIEQAISYPFDKKFFPFFKVAEIDFHKFKRIYENGSASTRWQCPDGVSVIASRSITQAFYLYSWSLTESNGIFTTGDALPCVKIDVPNSKTFMVRADAAVRFVVYQIEKTDGTIINLGPDQQTYLAPLGDINNAFIYYSSVYGYMLQTNRKECGVCIRDTNIKTVVLAVSGTLSKFEVYAINNPVFPYPVESVKEYGTTAERPSRQYLGQQYFDTDLGKLIIWNGTAWVNADGTPL